MSRDRSAEHQALVEELRVVRRAGLVRLRELDVPALTGLAGALEPGADGPEAVERLLRRAVGRLGGGTLREAAESTLGLAPGTRDWAAADRRRRTAGVYGVSVERVRKQHEPMVLAQLAERLAALAVPEPDLPGPVHRTLSPARGPEVRLHVHPVDLLRDVDVVVSPSNVYFALPEVYKSSVAATLRRAAAARGLTGELISDPLRDELADWLARHGTRGRPVLPGTIAATGPGELAAQGIRRIYHAAVAVPRTGTNDYDVLPGDVTRAATRALGLLAVERDRYSPPLRSICFPLLGGGRGGLDPAASVRAIWAAVEAESARGADWEVHLVMRNPLRAELVGRILAG